MGVLPIQGMIVQSIVSPDLSRDPQPADTLILWMPVFLASGIGTYFILGSEPSFKAIAILCAVCLAVVATTWRLRGSLIWRWAVSIAVLFCVGIGLAQFQTHQNTTHLLTHRYWNADISGTINSFERMGAGWRVVLTDARIEEDTKPYLLRMTIRMRGFVPALGDRLRVMGSLMPPSPPLIPGSYDFQRHAFFHETSGYGYATKIVEQVPVRQKEKMQVLENYRDWLTEKIYAQLAQPEAGVVTALLNGQRAGISRATTNVMQRSGLQHVISISGLHVGLMAATVFYITRLLMALSMTIALHLPIKKIAAGFAMIGIVFYMLIVGLSPPTVRSVLMTGVALLAIMLDRDPIQLRVVALAALLLMLLQPHSVLDIGFQMSFAAVIGLVSFYQATRHVWMHDTWKANILMKALRALIMVVMTSIIATLVTAPLVLFHFQQVPLLSMLANITATPLITFMIMPGTFLAYLATPFPVMGDWAIVFMGWGVKGMLMIAEWVAAMPASVWRAPSMPFSAMTCCMAGLFMLIAMKGRLRLVGLLPIILSIIIYGVTPKPDLVLTNSRVILYPKGKTDLVVDGRAGGFEKNMFLQWFGREKAKKMDCTSDICDIELHNRKVRFIRTIPALVQACEGHADIVMTYFYLDRPCKATRVIDRHDLDQAGSQAVFLQPSIHVKTGRTGTALRPWQQIEDKSRKPLAFQRKGRYIKPMKFIKGSRQHHDR